MKRTLSLCLTLLLLLGCLAPAGRAAVDPLSPSDAGVDFIKGFEGYRQYAYEDNGSWYIGYGTACGPDDYPEGVTEEEATGLLRTKLDGMANSVNNFLRNYSITLNQAQFDALCSFTYTLGTQWIDPEYRFCSYLIQGIDKFTQDEVVSAMATWCHVGGEPSPGVISRRMAEAYLFLTGDYSGTFEGQYVYLRHDPSGGTIEHSLLFFPIGQPYGAMQTPQYAGKVFQGWYTAEGEAITAETIATADLQVYAQWADLSEITQWDNPYSDLPDDHWSISYVRELSLLGIIDGYEDGTFRPNRDLRAGEALKLVLLAAGYPEQRAIEEHWASGYLAYAEANGWLQPGQVTDLDAPVSRQLVAQLVALVLELPESDIDSPFADTDDPYVLALYEAGIVEGDGSSGETLYLPENNILRSHICAIIWRMERYEPPEEPELSPGELGYIPYREHKVPILDSVPVCQRIQGLYAADSRGRITYQDSAVYTSTGIDVSAYQGDIDWQAVKADGIDFAIIRLGYRGYTQGSVNLDSKFLQNIEGARAAGLKVGIYFFSTAISPQEARDEAAFVLEHLGGRALELPIVYDWETGGSSYRNNDLDTETLTACAVAFCDAVEAAGYQSMVYFNLPTGYLKYDLSGLTQYDFWFAQYHDFPEMYYDYQIWQYSDSGAVAGIDGRVDMNLSFKEY